MQNLAEVRMWGKRVGALAHDAGSGLCTFEFAPGWIDSGVEIAPLHLPIGPGKFQFPALSRETYRGLPAVFADTLPDDFGNAVIDAWLARQGRDPASFTALERLLYTGSRGMGALEYAPSMRRDPPPDEQLELESLIAMAQRILDQRVSADIRIEGEERRDDAMKSLFQVGTSAGGARAKALVAVSPDRTRIRSGQVEAPPQYEQFLLKFDGVEEHRTGSQVFGDPKGYGRMEYAYYLMARDAGLDISPSELLLDGPRAHFMTRRFDRDGSRKLHYASLCAMDHADYKKPGAYSYEQLLAVARRLRLSRRDAIEIFRRMVFNVVARNHDDHSKNIGFLLDAPDSPWRLAPAFDVAYSYKKDSPWVNAHQLSLNGKRDNFSHSDLMAVAELIGNFRQQAQEIIEQVLAVVVRWPEYADQAGVSSPLAKEIADNLRLQLEES